MKTLSWKEPYGSLMLHGKIETRTWNTNVREPILICCSKKSYSPKQVLNISGQYQRERIAKIIPYSSPDAWDLNNGMAIAIGTLVNSRKMIGWDEDDCFVQHSFDLWCHVYENVTPLPKPFPVKGQMGFFNVHHFIEGDPGTMLTLEEWYNVQLVGR